MPDLKRKKDDPAESPTAWFAVLERALDTCDYQLAAKAQHELHRLGIDVRFRNDRQREGMPT
ncbi:MAG: hypothetical protein QUV05_20925 [Phycisphaerae bacterium]|nr:hypothetical protein [Phycisphaerae bacterium]